MSTLKVSFVWIIHNSASIRLYTSKKGGRGRGGQVHQPGGKKGPCLSTTEGEAFLSSLGWMDLESSFQSGKMFSDQGPRLMNSCTKVTGWRTPVLEQLTELKRWYNEGFPKKAKATIVVNQLIVYGCQCCRITYIQQLPYSRSFSWVEILMKSSIRPQELNLVVLNFVAQ